jgi:hypothetical protein
VIFSTGCTFSGTKLLILFFAEGARRIRVE